MSKKQKLFAGVMLGVMAWGFLALTALGIHYALTHLFGNTFGWIAPMGLIGYMYVIFMQYKIFKG